MEGYGGSANIRDYLDFDLEIRKDAPIGYSVSVRSPAGEAQEQISFPFNERQLRDKLKDLEIALLRSGGTRRSLSREELAVQDFGRSLFEALLVGDVRTRYLMSLDKAEQQDKGLRLKLRVQPPELAVLPWEFLYDSDRDYLCFSPDTPIVRYVDLRQPVRRLTVAPPLRILGMVASPRGLAQLDVEHEKELMNEAIEDLRDDGLVELTWLEGQTWRDLQRVMRRGGPWHVFHFVGHGEFDVAKEEGVIALTDRETGREHLLRSRDLARLLNGHRYLRLVFLNSCEGARGSEGDPFSGTAATLVRNRIPAVVAMQYQISDKAAIEFSRSFYEAVADGWPVDAAVTDARVAMSMDSMLEWGTPVLYMRSPDGRLFDMSTEVRAPESPPGETEDEEKEDQLRRYRQGLESVWVDGELHRREVEWLRNLANDKLGLSPRSAADTEREVMGDTIEAILERQERAARVEERRKRLEELYDRARRSHQDQEWPAVVDLFAQIHAEDPAYSDPEGLLRSANEALQRARSEAIEEEPHDATESARQKAQELGVDLSHVEGSGAGGRIIVKDVVSAAPQKRPAQEPPPVTNAITGAKIDRLRCLSTLGGHTDSVASVAFSPDGQLLASASDDRTVRLWRVEDGKVLRALGGHTNLVRSVAFSPDGQLLASGSWDHTVKVWRVEDGNLLRTLGGHTDSVASVAFSPDGQLLASGSWDHTVKVWRVEDWKLLRTLEGGPKYPHVASVMFSSDGRLLALGSTNGTVRLWRVEDWKLLRTLEGGHEGVVLSVAFSPDGRLLASGGGTEWKIDSAVGLWRVEDGKLLRTLRRRTFCGASVAFSPDGRLLALGSSDHTVRLLRVEDWKLLRKLEEGHRRYKNNTYAVFSLDGRLLASGSGDAKVRLWGIP